MKETTIIRFAGIPGIEVTMDDRTFGEFMDFVLDINRDRDLLFNKMGDWILLNISVPSQKRAFREWYCKTDTDGWFYPRNKFSVDQDPRGYCFSGLIMKPTITFNNVQYDNNILDRVIKRYCSDDALAATEALYYYRGICLMNTHIKDVIFNNPATIVFWSDGTKTVCTCSEADTYDPEKGLALCCMKKLLYKNKGHIFNNAREKWLKKYKKTKMVILNS